MLNTMKSILLGGVSLVCSFSAFAVTYVKPDATGEESGASWAEATSLEAAIQKGGVIYAAKGIYYPAATLQLTDGIQLYGGFAGTGDEAPDARDFSANETIVCGDTDKNDTWILYHPATGTSEKLTTVPVIKDGKINLPDFADVYETCAPNLSKSSSNLKRLVTVPEAANVTIDGFSFVGAGHADGGYAGLYVDGSAVATVVNCRFVACRGTRATVYVKTGGSLTFTKSSIEHCYADVMGVIDSPVNSTLVISDCRFIGNVRTASVYDQKGSAVICLDRGTRLSNSFFTRNYNCHTYANNTMESVCVGNTSYANEGVTCSGCTFVHNSCYDTTGTMTPIVHWNVGGVPVENCVIASNRTIVVSAAATVSAASAFASSAIYGAATGLAIFDNELTVTATAATVVDAAPVMANRSVVCDLTLLNSTVEDNAVTVTANDGADVAVARGVLFRPAEDSTARRALAVYNCTFMGETAGADVVYANPTEGGCGCVAYNCVFGTTHTTDTTPRVANLGVTSVAVGYGALLGAATVGANVDVSDMLVDDPLVGERAVVTEGRIPIRLLGAAVPNVRRTADVCLGTRQARRLFWYRRPGTTTWVLPSNYDKETTSPATYDSKTMIGDALGVTRPVGAFTVGSAQTLAPLAESGRTVVVRPDPADVGEIQGGLTHVMAADVGSYALTATSTSADYSFNSWRTLEDEIVSTDNPYVISSPGQGTIVLVARFNPASVTYTFDLGEHGLFDVCGLAVTNVTFRPDDPVVVPAYMLEADYAIRRWSPELPATAGAVSETFTPVYVTRVTRVETDGDLADALAAAAVYPGEAQVLLTGGTHELAAAVTISGNVTLVGEDGAVLKGASKQKWAIDGTADEDLSAVYCISNVTFVGSGVQPGLRPAVFTDCVFSNATAGGAFAALLAYTNVTCTGCTFADNVSAFHVLCSGSSLKVSCTFADCSFVGNRNGDTSMAYSGSTWYNNGIVSIENAIGFFTNCEFRANVNSKSAGSRGVIDSGSYGPVQVVGSRFEDNVVTNGYQMIYFGYYADGQHVKDSVFLGNRVVGGTGATGQSSMLRIQQTGKVQLNGNSFVSNVVDRVETGDKTADAMLVFAQGYLPKFLNCYFEGNRIRSQTASGATVPKASLVCLYGTIGIYDYGCCNNTFYNNDAPDGCFNIASNMDGARDNKWRFSNCIFRDTAGTKPFVYSAEATMRAHVVNCILTPVEDDRIVYAGCQDAALAFDSLRLHKGRLVRPVSPRSVLRQTGATVERDKDNHCVWVTVGGSRVIALGSTGGYLPNNPPFTPIEDMFGVYDGRNICGAYRKIPSGKGLVILLR